MVSAFINFYPFHCDYLWNLGKGHKIQTYLGLSIPWYLIDFTLTWCASILIPIYYSKKLLWQIYLVLWWLNKNNSWFCPRAYEKSNHCFFGPNISASHKSLFVFATYFCIWDLAWRVIWYRQWHSTEENYFFFQEASWVGMGLSVHVQLFSARNLSGVKQCRSYALCLSLFKFISILGWEDAVSMVLSITALMALTNILPPLPHRSINYEGKCLMKTSLLGLSVLILSLCTLIMCRPLGYFLSPARRSFSGEDGVMNYHWNDVSLPEEH